MADAAMSALNSLLRGSTIEDHDEALKLANAALKAAPKGSKPADLATAQHTKVVALLKLDRFDDALRTLADAPPELQARCALEKAYALYKTGALDAAAALCGDEPAARALRHVAAQVAYRAERFGHAAALYAGLAGDADEENDVRINVLAANAQLEWAGRGESMAPGDRQPAREDMEAFETAYNAACGCLGRGDVAKASVLLKRAKDLCEASEELSDEEKKAEILPFTIQQIYALTRLGKLDQAAALQKTIELTALPEGSTKTVAQSNSLAVEEETNPYMMQRVSAETMSMPTGGVKSRTSKSLKKETEATSAEAVSLGVLHAAAKAELQTGKEALKRVLPLLDTRPDDVGLLLTIIQLYIQAQNPMMAISLLETFFRRLEAAASHADADVRFAPGLVALAVALYRLQGRHAAARAELSRAAAHWQKSPGGSGGEGDKGGQDVKPALLRAAGLANLRSQRPADLASAGTVFDLLTRRAPADDKTAPAGLVAAFATTDPAKAAPHLAALTPVAQLVHGLDAPALLAAGVATAPTTAAAAAPSKKRKAPDAPAAAAATKRPRRLRHRPADFDAARKPDPERWLPLRDRSSFRPKGRKGKKRAAEATQGGVVREEPGETLELAGGAGSVRVERGPGGGAGGGGGGAGGKKKKKGKK